MPRNVDATTLKKLGYTTDPTPGDPTSITDASLYLAALTKKAGDASTKLAGLLQEGPKAPLMGEAAGELRAHVKDQLKLFVDKLAQATQLASTALSTYSTDLLAAQQRAGEALNAAAPLPENDPGLAAAKATMATARTMYLDAVEKARKSLASATALKTSPKTVAEEFWDFFKIFTIVLTVLGVLFGGPLGLLAFGANLVVLGKTIADFARGKASGLELFLNILGVLFPSTKALLPALLSGLKNLLVGLGKGAVNLFKGAGDLLSLLSTGLKGFNLAGWKFALAYASLLTGTLVFKGGALVGKLLTLPFKAIVWMGKTAWAVGKKGFGELKGWGSLGVFLPVAGDEIAKLGLARALRIGFWERGVLGSQKDFIRASLGVPPAAAGGAGKFGGHNLDRVPGLTGKDLAAFNGHPNLSIGAFDPGGIARAGSSFDTAVFVPAASGLYTPHYGLGVYTFDHTLLGHEGLQSLGSTVGHAAGPNTHWNSLHDVLNQATGGMSALHGLTGAVSPHTIGSAVEGSQSFTKSAIALGDDVRMTPLPEIRRLTHGDTTLTSVGTERFVAAAPDPLANKMPPPTSTHTPSLSHSVSSPGTPTSVHTPTPLTEGAGTRPTVGTSFSTAPTGGAAAKVDVFDMLAPAPGRVGSTPPPVPPAGPGGAGVSALHQDKAFDLLAGGSRGADQVPAVSARFTPVDLAGGNTAAPRPDLAGGRGATDTVSALVGEKIPLRADPPRVDPTPVPPASPPSTVGVGHPSPPPNALADFGAEQRNLVTKVLDDLADGPGPGAKSTIPLPGSRIEAWHDYTRAKHTFERAAAAEQALRVGQFTGDTSSGTVRAELMIATASRANAGLALADATTALKAWGVDPAVAAPAIAEALAKLPGLRGGTRPVGGGPDVRPRTTDSWRHPERAARTDESVIVRFDGPDGMDHFEIHGPMGPTGTRALLHDGYRLPDGTHQVFDGPARADSAFQVWADTDGTILRRGELRADGHTFRVTDVEGGNFQLWSARDAHGDHRVLADARRLDNRHFKVFDGPERPGTGFQIWRDPYGTSILSAHPGPNGTFHVHYGPAGHSDDFRVWGPEGADGIHPVLGDAHRLPDRTWEIRGLPGRAPDDFQVWGPRGADGAHPVLQDVYTRGDGIFQVYDGPRLGPTQDFRIRDAQGNITGAGRYRAETADFMVTNVGDRHFQVWDTTGSVLKTGEHLPGTDTFKVTGATGDDFQIWGPADAHGAHPVLGDARSLGDGTYRVVDGAPTGPTQDFRIQDGTGTVLKAGEYRPLSGDFKVTVPGGRDFEIWGPPAEGGTHPVLEVAESLGDGTYRVVEAPRTGPTQDFQIRNGEGTVLKHAEYRPHTDDFKVAEPGNADYEIWGPRPADGSPHPVLNDARALPDGSHQVYSRPRTGPAQDFQIWNHDGVPIKNGTRIPGSERFRVTGVDDQVEGFQIWGPREGNPQAVLADARRLGDGRYQVFDNAPWATERNFEVWADDAFKFDRNGGVHGRRVTQIGEYQPLSGEFKVSDRMRNTWEQWDSPDPVRHRLVEYPLDGPIAGVTRRIDHETLTWHDKRPPGTVVGHNVGWEHMSFRKGVVEKWPAGPDGADNGIRRLVDGDGTPVYTRDPSSIEGGGWIEGSRDHRGKWTWVEKTTHSRPIASGSRYVRWDNTSYDVIDGVFELNARHLFGGKVRDFFPQLDGGVLISEKSPLGGWNWQKWGSDGALQAKGRLDFRFSLDFGFKARVTHVKDGTDAALRDVGDSGLVAFEKFAPIRGGLGRKFFSAPDKARGTRQYTFEPTAQPANQFKHYIERNYVNEEVATFSKFGDDEFKARRIWQQRFDVPFFPGKPDFPGAFFTGDDRLFRHWEVSKKGGVGGTETIERSVRFQRLDGTWQDFDANGRLLRESRVLLDGRKIEFTATTPGGNGTWREVGGTGTGVREFGADHRWTDFRTVPGSEQRIVVREVVDGKGTVREYAGDPGANGPWVDRNRFGQIVERRDALEGGGFRHARMDHKPDGPFTWHRQGPDGVGLPGVENTGHRTTNRGGARMWGEGFDDGFKDFRRINGQDVLVYEHKMLGDGRVAVIERDAAGNYTTTVRNRAGAPDPHPGEHRVSHVGADGKYWRDEIHVNGDTHTIREGRGDAIREYRVDANGIPNTRHWDDFRNGTKIRSFEPITHQGDVVGYLEKDLAYLQQRLYDADGDIVVHQGFSTKIFEKLPTAESGVLNRIKSWAHPDKLGAAGVDSRFKLVGRAVDHHGALTEFRGYNRGLADTNRRHWGAPDALNGTREWTFEQKVWTKVGMEFMQDFGFSVLAGMITELINDKEISGSDWGRIFLNSAVSASFAGLMARLHELKFHPGSFSPKQFKDGLTANDFGKPFNTNPYFGDNWKTDWSNFDTALRWRSGLYKFGLGLAVNPIVAFVNGSINAAVFGDKNGVKHYGLDALKFGGVAALGSLATGAFGPGALKFGLDSYLAGRFWRKAGLLDLGIKFGEKLIDAQINKFFQNWLGLNDKYLYHPTPENGRQP
ncbi:hypothetical protein [Embleya scabrispora]|uniref:hypothetical protein n=1 Tax=Embleya scabrispora TaxID=159449 RepID=UPI0003A1EBA0|nr:hypothetical protein [Embleya scabrispora]MYS78677.1 hypothetical protein [Streptomyces sp. SID5474]